MSVFADTSALYPLLVRTEATHETARDTFEDLLRGGRPIWTTSFVLVETMALLQHRIGMAAAHDFDDDIAPNLRVYWVDEELYRRGTDRLWREDRRQLSLVDCTSMELMTLKGITAAFATDSHFEEAGFDLLPRRSRK